MDTRIYVITHKKIAGIPDNTYIPMQAGRAGKEDLGYLGDDKGDNISEKNPFYCELTGIYWLWKNVRCDIIGICHYRRYFMRDEKLLDRAYIENLIQKYPIIIPNSTCVKDANAYEHYAKRHYAKDLDLCREVIREKYPEYLDAFHYVMETILISVGNMWITRKDIFDRYCSWLFDILFEVEKRIDMTGYDDYQKRVMGFLSERLFRVWLIMQPEPVTEEDMKMIEASELCKSEKREGLLQKYISLKTESVLRLYRLGAVHETFAPYKECADDFDGKQPVWFCWLQGEMPEVIRCCMESLRRNIPKEHTVLRIITLENCMEYVTLTETIIRKFNEGRISMMQLSELLRAELLYRYGGMWIDPSYYTAVPISEEIFETLSSVSSTGIDIFRTKKESAFSRFLMECLWYYWEAEEAQMDNSVTAYMIKTAEEIPQLQEELKDRRMMKENLSELQELLDKKCTPERLQKIKNDSVFYKLDWQKAYRKNNLAGEQTVYGYLCAENIL